MNPEIVQLADLRGGHTTKENTKPPEGKKERSSLFYDLISVRVGAVLIIIKCKDPMSRKLKK